MATYFYGVIAQVYGAGAYNSSTYGAQAASSGNGGLSDTGIAIASIITVAAVLMLTALVVRVWRRPSKSVAPRNEQ